MTRSIEAHLHGLPRAIALACAAAVTLGNGAPAQLQVTLDHVRSTRGLLQLCLTRDIAAFPDCSADPTAVKVSVAAGVRTVILTAPQPGRYALAVLHDANANGRADTTLGIPREGFGFSRNPAIRFGPPRFADAAVEIGPGLSRQTVRMLYLI